MNECTQNLSAKYIKNSYDDVLIFCIFIYSFFALLFRTRYTKKTEWIANGIAEHWPKQVVEITSAVSGTEPI